MSVGGLMLEFSYVNFSLLVDPSCQADMPRGGKPAASRKAQRGLVGDPSNKEIKLEEIREKLWVRADAGA